MRIREAVQRHYTAVIHVIKEGTLVTSTCIEKRVLKYYHTMYVFYTCNVSCTSSLHVLYLTLILPENEKIYFTLLRVGVYTRQYQYIHVPGYVCMYFFSFLI